MTFIRTLILLGVLGLLALPAGIQAQQDTQERTREEMRERDDDGRDRYRGDDDWRGRLDRDRDWNDDGDWRRNFDRRRERLFDRDGDFDDLDERVRRRYLRDRYYSPSWRDYYDRYYYGDRYPYYRYDRFYNYPYRVPGRYGYGYYPYGYRYYRDPGFYDRGSRFNRPYIYRNRVR